MVLQSKLFRGDTQLEAAAASDPAHILLGARGAHVGKIQQALNILNSAIIAQDSVYGPATAAAVRAFKQKRRILNSQGQIDDIVGKKTIAALDAEMLAKEKGGGGLRLNFIAPVSGPTRTHTLIYFSGASDTGNTDGVLLIGGNKEKVQIGMENLTTVAPEDKVVLGFGGTTNNLAGVAAALAFIVGVHDPAGKLIIYGFSVGGVNALQLCRALNGVIGSNVNLLVTVDVSGDPRKPPDSGAVPPNVNLNRNYFQVARFPSRGPSGIKTFGGKVVVPIDCSNDSFDNPKKGRHGQMDEVTRNRAIQDMRTELARK